MSYTWADIFSGCGGAKLGAIDAGLRPLWSLELEQERVDINNLNLGDTCYRGDILTTHPAQFPHVDIMHFSPPCIRASVANTQATEDTLDTDLADAIVKFVIHHKPRAVTLENVHGYRTFTAFEITTIALYELGYHAKYWHLNSADYGVPQTRKRLIMIAARDFVPQPPKTTHYNPNGRKATKGFMGNMFMKPWVGWYEAIEDILHELPESKFAPWQEPLVAEYMRARCPSPFWVNDSKKGGDGATIRQACEPATTVKTLRTGGHPPRAFIIGQGTRSAPLTIERPYASVTGNSNQLGVGAFLLNGANATSARPIDRNAPAMTVVKSNEAKGSWPRAWLSHGRIVKMNLQAMSRFQSFPDWFQGATMAMIGDAVPPLMYRRIAESLITQMNKRYL